MRHTIATLFEAGVMPEAWPPCMIRLVAPDVLELIADQGLYPRFESRSRAPSRSPGAPAIALRCADQVG